DFELIFFNVQDAVVGYCPEKMDESNYFPAGGAGYHLSLADYSSFIIQALSTCIADFIRTKIKSCQVLQSRQDLRRQNLTIYSVSSRT
ncbi:MAG: hypothetical protein ABFQ95_08190, partial [Pseudomonadota bacterium]